MDFGVLSIIGSVVSGVTGFVGSMQQASAQKEAAEYSSAVARNNQIIAQQNAERSAQAGRVQAQSRDLRTRAVVGQIEASQGASGIDLGSESSKEVRQSAEQLGRFDARTVLDNAMLTSRAETVQASNFGAEAELQKQKAASINPFMSGVGSLLGGATSFADKWTRFKSPTSDSGSLGDFSPRGGF
jgi:hypothetical protein